MNITGAMESLPDATDADMARASAKALSALLTEMPRADRAQIRIDGHDLILPKSALELLRNILSEMARGNAVTVVPTHAELTTQEAADILNVSRPYLIKLLDTCVIPHHRLNKHRRIRLDDLMSYKKQQHTRSPSALDDLAKQAQELGLY